VALTLKAQIGHLMH